MTKREQPGKALVILRCGEYDPHECAGVYYLRVVDCDSNGRIGPIKERTLYGARLHSWGVVKNASLVDRFLAETKSVKGAHIRGNWFRAMYLQSVIDFMDGEAAFGERHRLAYLKDALDCRAAFAKRLMRAMTADTYYRGVA